MSDDLLTPSISIHALREESDQAPVDNMLRFHISIHALREESDFLTCEGIDPHLHFNPRSP